MTKVKVLMIMILLLCFGCASVQTPDNTDLERQVFNALKASFTVYDLGMTTAATLRDSKTINQETYLRLKEVGWKFYNGLVAADKLARIWVEAQSADKAGALEKLTTAIKVCMVLQDDFTKFINSVRRN